MALTLLHGTLHVTIFGATSISNPDRATGGAPQFFRKLVENIEEAVGIGKGATQLYATIDLERGRVGRTRLIDEPVNPRWNESFYIYCAHLASNVVFSIKVANPIGATLIGRAYLSVKELFNGQEVDRWLDIVSTDRKPLHGDPKIHVKLQFFDVSLDRNWSLGIRSPTYPGVPYTFFTQRHGCRVSLYQDAHVPDNFVPKIPLAGGKSYEPQRCWEDIFDAITNAKHLIYITGWSVYTEFTLIRDSRRAKPGGDNTLGELLKKKASEGVRVLMLVWDDRFSGELSKDGVMGTHDEETANYFQGTDVHCVLCPRNPDNGGSFIKNIQIATMFTHHQKIVVVDSEAPNGSSVQRRIVSYVGGLDLCDGRYDTPFHSLFRTLDTTHHDDFHQPNFKGASISQGGPREPWHDIHSRLEGPVAWDVLLNFEQRWRKQGGKDVLVQLQDLADSISPPSPVTLPDDHETWNVQVFRSIDGGAVFGFPETPEAAARVGLVSGKDNIIDRSIQDGYINAIRRAKNFIYIENQYFLGSSFGWRSADDIDINDIDALHLIPKELSLKIVSKIEARERFTVYVVVPMWPEQIADSEAVQAILDWQRRTMEMMYTDITEALKAKGIQANPKDYLALFCLGNREVQKEGEYTPSEKPEPDTDYSRAQQARRFMIYVHAKMMIVDDEYIIIGSANLNQRSMDGSRDSEIAMGAYQPYHLSNEKPARGQIHGFRMSLWYEHLGMLDDSFLKPESLECIQMVNTTASKYWDLYASDTLEHDLPGHLLSYPIGVTSDGVVTQLPGIEFFPDTKGQVLGCVSLYPPILTT